MSQVNAEPSLEPQVFSKYEPQPYVTDGGFSVGGLNLMLGVGMISGLLLGLAAGFVGQFFYIVLLFPILIGLAVAATQIMVIEYSKIRNPLICGVAGLVAGLVAVISVHLFDYSVFKGSVADSQVACAAMRDQLGTMKPGEDREMLQKMLFAYRNDPDVKAAQKVDSFFGYIDWSASQGVRFGEVGDDGDEGVNLGYTGSYVYWGLEALIVATLCCSITRHRSSQPFCVACDNWITERELGALQVKSKPVVEIFESGNVDRLRSMVPDSHETAVTVFQCNCDEIQEWENDVVLQVNNVVYNEDTRGKQEVGRFVYPAAVVSELTTFFGAGIAEEAELVEATEALSASSLGMTQHQDDDLAELDPEVLAELRKAAAAPDYGSSSNESKPLTSTW